MNISLLFEGRTMRRLIPVSPTLGMMFVFILLIGCSPDPASVDPPSPDLPDLNGVTFGDSLFVAYGWKGTILTSPDGITWTSRASGISDDDAVRDIAWSRSVYWGGSTFVAITQKARILTSHDGVAWLLQSGPGTSLYSGIAWNESFFMIVGAGGRLVRCEIGINLVTIAPPTPITFDLYDIAWNGSVFVIVGQGGKIYSSTSWTQMASGTVEELRSICWNGSLFIAVGWSGTVLTSPDGITWTERASGTFEDLYGIAASIGGALVAVGKNGAVATSPDGITWSSRTSGTTNGLYGITFARNRFVAVGALGKIMTSPDGITWTSRR
jgi:hypothetical protein